MNRILNLFRISGPGISIPHKKDNNKLSSYFYNLPIFPVTNEDLTEVNVEFNRLQLVIENSDNLINCSGETVLCPETNILRISLPDFSNSSIHPDAIQRNLDYVEQFRSSTYHKIGHLPESTTATLPAPQFVTIEIDNDADQTIQSLANQKSGWMAWISSFWSLLQKFIWGK